MTISQMSHSCGDLEVRTCGEHLLQKEPHTTVEIIRWFFVDGRPVYNISLAYYEKSPDGYSLRFVGERLFDPEVSQNTFMQLAGIGLRHLKASGYWETSTEMECQNPRLLDPQEQEENHSQKDNYEAIGAGIGKLVAQKQTHYGDSFGIVPKILVLLFPDGVKVEQYGLLLTIVRVLDKVNRAVTQHPSDKESPWEDIAGYSILELAKKIRAAKL